MLTARSLHIGSVILIGGMVLLGVDCSPLRDRAEGQVAETGRDQPAWTAGQSTEFAELHARLSEPGGYFDTDNLISNETSYLHVLGRLEALDLEGGAYLGVGPDQSFSYIAQVRPEVAFIIDIRRDNVLQHLLYKSLFARARNRMEYLALWLGRSVPEDVDGWRDTDIEELVRYMDEHAATGPSTRTALAAVADELPGFGIPLSDDDRATIERFHREFIEAGLSLRFRSHNRAPRPYYPTLRQLVLEHDLEGNRGSYLAHEDRFQFLKRLQQTDRIAPVVGDLAGDHAVRAVGDWLREHEMTVTAFYTSNVEFYLMRNGTFDRFAENVARLPLHDRAVIIRSFFGGFNAYRHPQNVNGYFSTQLLQPIAAFNTEYAADGFQSYFQLVTKHALELGQVVR